MAPMGQDKRKQMSTGGLQASLTILYFQRPRDGVPVSSRQGQMKHGHLTVLLLGTAPSPASKGQ